MLTDLLVEDLGVIGSAEVSLERGCTALTGETGAGKTLVVAALSLLLGARADRTLVREGAAEARVEGRFVMSRAHPAATVLAGNGLLDDGSGDAEIVVSRTVGADGRTGRVRVNGRLATVGLLAECGSLMVELAGQHEYQSIGRPAAQRAILDSVAGPKAVATAARVAETVRAAARARRSLEDLRASARERERELDVLRFEIAEIEAADVRPGEGERLAAEARRLENAHAAAGAVAGAVEFLAGDSGALDLVFRARAEVESMAGFDDSAPAVAARLDGAAAELTDVASELARHTVEPDPEALEETRARLAVLARLRRKYGDDDHAVLDYLERARARVVELEAAAAGVGAAESEAVRLAAAGESLAGRLSDLRRAATPRLEDAASAMLARLAMPEARVEIALLPKELYEGGLESVEIRIAADRGTSPRPVARVASGGELARISLALRLLTATEAATTMVFDEVDAGVGGAASQSIGHALADLARRSGAQVIVVTHLPQVAAFADHHLTVSKTIEGRRATSRVERVVGANRVAELSRMLSGLPDSDRAREHARELLELAGASE